MEEEHFHLIVTNGLDLGLTLEHYSLVSWSLIPHHDKEAKLSLGA